jgi:hypothetical protein
MVRESLSHAPLVFPAIEESPAETIRVTLAIPNAPSAHHRPPIRQKL